MNKNKILFLLTMGLAVISGACTPNPPPTGFRVSTTRTTFVNGSPLPTTIDAPNIGVNGNFEHHIDNATPSSGSVAGFTGVTNNSAYYDVNSAKLPGVWRLGETSGPCAGQHIFATIRVRGHTAPLDCRDIPITFFNFLPSMIQRDYPPASITIDGTGITAQGGMPTVEYYDLNGTLVAQSTASEVASGGNSLTAPAPNLSLFGSGAYIALVRNADGNSPGNGVVVIFDYFESPSEPPPDPGSCGEYQVCPVQDGY
ncbi:MAG: hypothetical protein WAM70_06955 [Pyrinomonadaceae bacterium]